MRAWLNILRASGLLTILSDAWATVVITAAWGLAATDVGWAFKRWFLNLDQVGWVLASGACCYLTGMVWNDIADVQRDRVIAPQRPLPSGRIPVLAAVVVALVLPVAALACAAQVTHGFLIAGTVIALSLLYNLWAKQIPWLGSLVMGLTRGAHALMAVLIVGSDAFAQTLQGHGGGWVYAMAVTIYTIGLTVISELQHRPGKRWEALCGFALMLIGVLCAVSYGLSNPWLGTLMRGNAADPVLGVVACVALGGVALLMVTSVFKPIWQIINDSVPTGFGSAVGMGLGGLILLAAIAACAAYPLAGVPLIGVYYAFRWVSARIRMD